MSFMIRIFYFVFLSVFLISCSAINSSQFFHNKKEGAGNIASENSYKTGSDNMSKMDNISGEPFLPDFTLKNLYKPELSLKHAGIFDKKLDIDPEVKEQSKYDIPIVVTERVKYYLELYARRYPHTFQKWLNRSYKYMYIVQDIFLKHGLPLDLACLAFAESGFNVSAYSHAGAGGMWQFIESTGEIYGLKNNFWVDERRDFEKSTEAAAEHLKYLYENLGDWFLAIAAYNGGYYKVVQGIKRYDTKNFFELKEHRFLYRETENYVPKFIALTILYNNYMKYGFKVPDTSPLVYDKVILNQPVNLYVIADRFNISVEKLKELNPSLKKPITPPTDGFALRVPFGKGGMVKTALAEGSPKDFLGLKIYRAERGESVWKIANKFNTSVYEFKRLNGINYNRIVYDRIVFVPNKKLYTAGYYDRFLREVRPYVPSVYIVKKGDNLYDIAHRFGLSLNDLLAMNKGINPRLIHPGDTVVVSKRTEFDYVRVAKNGSAKYVVRRGDTLWDIAKRFGTSVNRIMRVNGLENAKLMPGNVLVVPN
ncbi:Lytic transglycosylase catalytic [Flexistipes sinusarabici DSM 4947]|uniref:Lytic transglycosylase catalytic n=2 Tax=Flexistipes sinusarabici TaxID=2352 RepID=F8E911_FLESM|nr:Lytic transglycosylase catalytic [Flexistipes sinusarabici DSM 4947]